MTLTEFLLARIAEDADDARDLPPAPSSSTLPLGSCWECGTNILAECEAKRRIVEQADWERAHADANPADPEQQRSLESLDWACRVLATVYADHPDYRDEWKP